MSTSIHKGRLLTGRTWDGNAAIDAGFVRDVVLNNACHLADVAGQTRVNFGATSTSFDDQVTYYTAPATDFEVGEWYPVASFGPWPLPLRADGSPYRLRVLVGGAAANAFSAGYFRVVIAPNGLRAGELFGADRDYVYEAAITATTIPAWLTGASQGTQAYENMIEIPSSIASTWITNVTTLDDIGGNEVGCPQCLVSAFVYTQLAVSAVDPVSPRLYGLHVAEWIGVDE